MPHSLTSPTVCPLGSKQTSSSSDESSAEDANDLESEDEEQNDATTFNSSSAAFVEFQVPDTIVASALPLKSKDRSDESAAAASAPQRGIVFVPCSQDADVAGEFTLTVYSTRPLSWHTAPLMKLLNPKKAFLGGDAVENGLRQIGRQLSRCTTSQTTQPPNLLKIPSARV